MTIEIESASEADTLAAGRRLAALLKPGDVILLAGALGTGKTMFTSGLAEGLGVQERVTSPSFVIVRSYSGLIPLVHADVYRLGSMAELHDLDLGETAEDAVLVIEWGQAVQSELPADHLVVEFQRFDDDRRVLRFIPHGDFADRPLQELAP